MLRQFSSSRRFSHLKALFEGRIMHTAAAPRIDGLIVISDDRRALLVVGGEQRDEPILRGVDARHLHPRARTEALLILLGCFVALEQVIVRTMRSPKFSEFDSGEPALILQVNVGDPFAGRRPEAAYLSGQISVLRLSISGESRAPARCRSS